jgi:Kef-type K+ transport system membrane component KefB
VLPFPKRRPGGLTANLGIIKANIGLSVLVGMTGLLAPIGLSFILLHLVFGYSLISSFAAGSALCSTSLGTTFTLLSAHNLAETRLGSVLMTAAVLDDSEC